MKAFVMACVVAIVIAVIGGVVLNSIQEPADKAVAAIRFFHPPKRQSPLKGELLAATQDAYQRLIRPAMTRELRRRLTEAACEHAIKVFGTNLRNLLLAPPLRGRTILAIDPGFRTGCKVAIISSTGADAERLPDRLFSVDGSGQVHSPRIRNCRKGKPLTAPVSSGRD